MAGTLKLGLTNDAVSQLRSTDTLTILSSTGTLTGTFSNAANGARLTTSDGYGSFVVNYTAHAVTLGNFVATDSDGDGIPDAWTQQYFGHPGGLASATWLSTWQGPTRSTGPVPGVRRCRLPTASWRFRPARDGELGRGGQRDCR